MAGLVDRGLWEVGAPRAHAGGQEMQRKDRAEDSRKPSRSTAIVAAVAALALGGLACVENHPGQPRVTLPIDSVVELRLAEDESGILILARTRREYGCLGYQLTYDLRAVRLAPKELALDLLGVRPPSGVCATALGPARATIELGHMSESSHPIAIRVNDVTVAAVITVTPDELIVEGGEGPWTVWPEPRMAR